MDFEEVDTKFISADRLGVSKIRLEEILIMLNNVLKGVKDLAPFA